MDALIDIQHLQFYYHALSGELKALEDVSFCVAPGEFIGIVGPSGCGKSTILSLIFGLLTPAKGHIILNPQGEKPTKIGYMLQKDHLLEWLSIYKNITLGLEINHDLTPAREEKILGMLEDYGLSQFKNASPSQLSGGMRQRAALIRTLALEPELLLLDEPFSALDYQTRLNVADDIYQILRQQHKTGILVTHDISEAISFCDRVVILSQRPARVKTVMTITLSVEEKTPFKARTAPEFSTYFNRIWRDLNE